MCWTMFACGLWRKRSGQAASWSLQSIPAGPAGPARQHATMECVCCPPPAAAVEAAGCWLLAALSCATVGDPAILCCLLGAMHKSPRQRPHGSRPQWIRADKRARGFRHRSVLLPRPALARRVTGAHLLGVFILAFARPRKPTAPPLQSPGTCPSLQRTIEPPPGELTGQEDRQRSAVQRGCSATAAPQPAVREPCPPRIPLRFALFAGRGTTSRAR